MNYTQTMQLKFTLALDLETISKIRLLYKTTVRDISTGTVVI